METSMSKQIREREEKRIEELSKGYTKAQLINIIVRREEEVSRWTGEVSKLSKELKTLKEESGKNVQREVAAVHNKYYEKWCEQNEKFLKRWMDSYLKSSLGIKVDGDFGNSISVSLLYKGQEIAEDTGFAISGHNPLDV